MVKGGWKRIETSDHSDEVDYTFVYSNQELEKILKTVPLRDFIYSQHQHTLPTYAELKILQLQRKCYSQNQPSVSTEILG